VNCNVASAREFSRYYVMLEIFQKNKITAVKRNLKIISEMAVL